MTGKKKYRAGISADQLRYLFNYDPSTGNFTRLVTTGPTAKVGRLAGCAGVHGYRYVKIDGTSYAMHRLAWVYMYGEWPADQIDHINGLRHDNRIANLRQATNSENCKSRKTNKNNTSGYKGVTWYARAKKWQASIRVDGKLICLGYFRCPKEAHESYCAAATEHYGDFARFA